jgi:hypothetical protein
MTDTPPPARCSRCHAEDRLPGDSYGAICRRWYRREHARLQRRNLRLFKQRNLSMETMDDVRQSVQTDD